MIAAIILCEEANRKLFFFSSFQADTFCPILDFRGSQHFDKNILLGKNCFDRCKMTNWACRELFFCLPPVNISASWLSGAVNFRSFLRVWLWKLICAVEMPSCQNRTVLGWQAYLSSWRVHAASDALMDCGTEGRGGGLGEPFSPPATLHYPFHTVIPP